MKKIILKITERTSDAEILEYDNVERKEYFKSISIVDLIEKLETFVENRGTEKHGRITLLDDCIIGYGNGVVVINQPEHKRIVTYMSKAYNINFPNAIYIMSYKLNKISAIEAYCYREFNGKDTEMFKYAMPNMLTGSRICTGTAPKDIANDDYVQALEKVIFTQYTHAHTDNIKSFKDTKTYFEYLSKNAFPYDLLIGINKKLKDIV